MNSEIINLDSIDGSYTDAFDCKFPLMNSLRNVTKIHLKSLELPITFSNIRATGTLNIISLKTNLNNTYSISIPEANYTTLSGLLTAINNAFVGVIPLSTVTFAQIGSSNRLTCTIATTGTFTSFTIVDTSLSKYVLGFRYPSYSGLVATSTVDFILNVDNYISLYLANVRSLNNTNRLCSFKIPLTTSNGVILFDGESTSFKQFLDLGNDGQMINTIHIKVYDRFNQQILSNNADYSLTLMFEYI